MDDDKGGEPGKAADGQMDGSQNVADSVDANALTPQDPGTITKYDLGIFPMLPRCRYDSKNPPKLNLPLNLLFAFAATFTVANLYYAQPLLHLFSVSFDVGYSEISNIPVLAQAG